MTTADHVGRGFKFPMATDHTGRLAMTDGADLLDDSIVMILSTAPGERVMRPDFGCAIWNQLFDPINRTTLAQIAHSVEQALGHWEPRIDVDHVDVAPTEGDTGRVDIEIVYKIRGTNDARNLVYPFYVIPQEGES
jgi:phage baseplate assembly protein W